MRYPAFLPEQGTIGFVAPSFGAYIEPYHTAFLAALEQFWVPTALRAAASASAIPRRSAGRS